MHWLVFVASFGGMLFLFGCTKPVSPTEKKQVEYFQATEARLGEWQSILENLRRNRDMHAVHSDVYKKRSETLEHLEKEVKEAEVILNEAKQKKDDPEAKAKLEAKFTEMKDGYFRPTQPSEPNHGE